MDPLRGISSEFPAYRPDKALQPSDERPSFQDTLTSFVKNVDAEIKQADRMTGEFAVGERQSLHEIMIATEKAGISFKLLMSVRNKLLEAYQEIMRMQF
ncbi:MAG: flagellar hook-basal body complex protein FliE [Desulfobacteraceae bacterium]|jgi:flagellar hook-basal body complex protein FliE